MRIRRKLMEALAIALLSAPCVILDVGGSARA